MLMMHICYVFKVNNFFISKLLFILHTFNKCKLKRSSYHYMLCYLNMFKERIYKFCNRPRRIDKCALYLFPPLRNQSEKSVVQQSAVPLRRAFYLVVRNGAAPLPVCKHAVRILRDDDNARLQYRVADDRLSADARAGNQSVRNVVVGSHPHRKRIRRVRSRICPHRNLYGSARHYMPCHNSGVQTIPPRKLPAPQLKPSYGA